MLVLDEEDTDAEYDDGDGSDAGDGEYNPNYAKWCIEKNRGLVSPR